MGAQTLQATKDAAQPSPATRWNASLNGVVHFTSRSRLCTSTVMALAKAKGSRKGMYSISYFQLTSGSDSTCNTT
jgi:hypothetical protein